MKEANISKNIADLRKQKGITQEQLALALNTSPQAVSKWETNISQPDTQTLPLIADYFDVSIDYLFYGEDFVYNDIYKNVYDKTAKHPQMSLESFLDAHFRPCSPRRSQMAYIGKCSCRTSSPLQ